jgi:HD-like signal output (HDOD) protein
MGGFLERVRRLLAGAAGPPPGAAPPPRAGPRPEARPPAAPPPEAAAAGPGDFGPLAAALGIPVPPPEPEPSPEAEAGESRLAGEVLEHFRKNRPGPASAPSLSLRIINLVAAPDADIGELARLVSADPALAAGVLTVANSANYRAVAETQTVREAIARLGFDEVARIAGAVSARSLFNPKLKAELQAYGPAFAALYQRALTAASGAARLAMRQRGGRSDRAFLGGMLHDVGKSIALRSVAALALEGRLRLPAGDPRLARLLDRVHLEVGGEVHQEWSMPQYLTVVAVRHHDPSIPAGQEFVDLHRVRLASALCSLRSEPAFAARAAAEATQSAGALGLDHLQVRELWTELREIEQRTALAFAIDARR